MTKNLRSPRAVWSSILTALCLFWGLVVWLVLALTGCAEPDRLAEVTATAEPTAQTATVTVDGEGVATDVTVTVIDPDTGLSAEDAAGGLDAVEGEPGVSVDEVGDTTGKTISQSDVQLPYSTEVLLEPGQQVTVTAQNGTGGGDIAATVTVDGQTTTDRGAGYGAVAEATGVNE